MVACAIGCLFLERLYAISQFVVTKELPVLFQIGTFGSIGCFMFLFTANFGTFDSLVDDGTPALKKYRFAAFAAPLLFVAAGVIIVLSPANPGIDVTCAIEELFMGAAAYFSFKNLIIPNNLAGIFSSLKLFHLLSILLAVFMTAENILWCYDVQNSLIWIIVYVLIFLAVPALPVVLDKGVKKWKA